MKKNILFITMLFIAFVNSLAQTKVLFLGNSFTKYVYNVPAMFSSMASAAGISVTVDSRTQPGMAVATEQMAGHIVDATSQNKINAQNWDYIVVQDNLGNYAGSVGNIPSHCYNANVTLYNQIKTNYNCSRIVYFAGWGPNGGTSSGDNTTNCINRIHGNMIALNNSIADEIVTPIGKSWIASLSQLPGENLYSTDNLHPSLAGAYIAMATIFTTIFKTDLTNVNYDPGLNPGVAQTMRTIAFNTVTNSTNFTATHLNAFTPTITVNGATLTCNGNYPTYQWYLNGTSIAGATNKTHIATANGKYRVSVTDSSSCPMSSFEVTLTSVGIYNLNNDNKFNLKPLGNNHFDLTSDQEIKNINVYDMQGKLIITKLNNTQNCTLDLSAYPSGIYLLNIITPLEILHQKIYIP